MDDTGSELHAELGRPEMPDAAARISAFAQALGLTLAHLLTLLESYDLCLLDGKAGPSSALFRGESDG